MHMLGSVTAPKGTLPLWRGGLWVLYQASWKLGNQENVHHFQTMHTSSCIFHFACLQTYRSDRTMSPGWHLLGNFFTPQAAGEFSLLPGNVLGSINHYPCAWGTCGSSELIC